MPPTWPTLPAEHLLLQLHARLPALIAAASGHNRIWGLSLNPASAASSAASEAAPAAAAEQPDFQTLLVLQKFLRSTQGDVEKASEALGKTLQWRLEFGLDGEDEAGGAVKRDAGDARFEGLGFVTKVGFEGGEGEKAKGREVVVTWNIYGAAKGDLKGVFGDLEKFLHWRVNLMEEGIAATLAPVLSGADDAPPIPDYGKGEDPYQGYQVHDYMDVSFLRMDPAVKAATKATIEIMSAHYPEWLSRKFFVSVPLIMSWVFQAVRLIVSSETSRKFTVVSYKSNLLGEFDAGGVGKARAEDVPAEYGGKAEGGLEAIEI
ncbi:hypothetical protein JCM6882_008869 [Rhodosporidiobolus microsporus]